MKLTIISLEMPDPDELAPSELREIKRAITVLQHEVHTVMGTIAETEQALASLSQKVVDMNAGIDNVAGDIATCQQEIQSLKDQIANTEVPQSITDSVANLASLIDGVSAKVQTVAAIIPDPPAPPQA